MTVVPHSATPEQGAQARLLGADSRPTLRLVSDDMGWNKILAAYAKTQRAGNLSEKTIQNRHECLLMLAHRTGKRLQDINLDDLEELLARPHHRSGKSLSQGTMQSERSYLQSFFSWARERGHRTGNPAKKLRKVKMTRRKPRPLRAEQIDAMLDTGAYSRTRDIITIAALTGLRLGEVVQLRGEDIDVDGMTIRAVRKGDLHWRGPLPVALLPIVAKYPTRGWWFPSPYKSKLFPHGGGHILMSSASDAVSKAIRRAGITDPNITGHSLRHYLATTMLHEGTPIRVVQEILGHASLATTQLYAGVTDQDMTDGANSIPAIKLRARSGRGRIVERGPVAQLAEHLTFNQRVAGSSPAGPTSEPRAA